MAVKTVLITGCSAGGIGSALAESFEKRGIHVFATARTLSKMSHLENRPNVTLLELDVTSPSSIAAALEFVKTKTGTLDYLVNNSGQAMVMPVLDTNLEEAKKMFDVNLWGVFAMTQAFAPLVIASKGSLVNICSIAGYLNSPWMGEFALHLQGAACVAVRTS
jgi:NADP-dependent 3-hydroxy acid dehydrogenase YdfG